MSSTDTCDNENNSNVEQTLTNTKVKKLKRILNQMYYTIVNELKLPEINTKDTHKLYTEELIKNAREYVDDDKNIYLDEISNRIYVLYKNEKKKETFTKLMNKRLSSYKELLKDNNDDAESDDSGESILKTALYMMTGIFVMIMIYYYFTGVTNFLKSVAYIIIIFGFSTLSDKLLDLLNDDVVMKTDNVSESRLYDINDINDFTTSGDLLKFVQDYLIDMDIIGSNIDVYTKDKLDKTFNQHKIFMLKSENTHIGNKTNLEQYQQLYHFLKGDYNEKKLLYVSNIIDDKYDNIRKSIHSYFEKKDERYILDKFIEDIDLYLDENNKLKNVDTSDKSLYNLLLSGHEDGASSGEHIKGIFYNKLKFLLDTLKDIDTNDDWNMAADCYNLITILNIILSFIKYLELPEYNEIFKLLYSENQTLSQVYNESDKIKYANVDELKLLKRHLIGTSKPISKVLDDYSNIIKSFRANDTVIELYWNNHLQFVTKCKKENILKIRLSDPYTNKNDVDLIQKVFETIFKYSNVKRNTLISYLNKRIHEDKNIESIEVFSSNVRKIIDTIFDNIEVSKDNLVLIDKPFLENDNRFITFNQFTKKIDYYDEDAMNDLTRIFDQMHTYVLTINNNSENSNNELKIREKKNKLFKEAVYYYITSTMILLIDYMLQLFMGDTYTKSPNRVLTRNADGNLKVKSFSQMKSNVSTYAQNFLESNSSIRKINDKINKEEKTLRRDLNKLKNLYDSMDVSTLIGGGTTDKEEAAPAEAGTKVEAQEQVANKNEDDSNENFTINDEMKELLDKIIKTSEELINLRKVKQDLSGKKEDLFNENEIQNIQRRKETKIWLNKILKYYNKSLSNKINEDVINMIYLNTSNTYRNSFSDTTKYISQKMNRSMLKKSKQNGGTGTIERDDDEINNEIDDKNLEKIQSIMSKSVDFVTRFSIWILSVILLYTYWMKLDANVDYEKMITMNNTNDLKLSILKTKTYSYRLYRLKLKHGKDVGHKGREIVKKLYDSMKENINIYDKCNYVKPKSDSVPFPMTEVILALILIGICGSIVMGNNILNNPFTTYYKLQKIQTMLKYKGLIKKVKSEGQKYRYLLKIILKTQIDMQKNILNYYDKLIENQEAIIKDYNKLKTEIDENKGDLKNLQNEIKTKEKNLSEFRSQQEIYNGKDKKDTSEGAKINNDINSTTKDIENLKERLASSEKKVSELETKNNTNFSDISKIQIQNEKGKEYVEKIKKENEEYDKEYKKIQFDSQYKQDGFQETDLQREDGFNKYYNKYTQSKDLPSPVHQKDSYTLSEGIEEYINKLDSLNEDYETLKGIIKNIEESNDKQEQQQQQQGGSTTSPINENERSFLKQFMSENQLDKKFTTESDQGLKYQLQKLQELDLELGQKDDKSKTLITFSLSFSIFMIAIYLSYTLFNNTVRYRSQLFNGKMLSHSVCQN